MAHWLRIVAFLVTGAIFGPVLLALATALYAPADRATPAANDLLSEYDSRNTMIPLSSGDFSEFARRCGYDPYTLFTDKDLDSYATTEPWRWTPHAGYFELAMLQSENWSRRLFALRAAHLGRVTTDFSARFLRSCMRETLFGALCERRTRALLGEWHSAYSGPASVPRNQLDSPGEQGMICAYLDGVAARRGLPLAKR